jgi:hypothetical protein
MKSVPCAAVVIALATQVALADKQVFVSSADYDITVQLNYTREVSPEGEQGGFSSYTSTGEFKNVRFGPSPSKEFAAWFERRLAPGAAVPVRQISGEGRIGPFVIAPAWQDPNETIEPRITAGPLPFAPGLDVLTYEMAHAEDEDSMPLVPLVSTVWLRYNEGFSIAEPELKWEYPGFAKGQVESDGVVFSVPLTRLANGEDIEVNVPYENGAAHGEWKIVFWANEEEKK